MKRLLCAFFCVIMLTVLFAGQEWDEVVPYAKDENLSYLTLADHNSNKLLVYLKQNGEEMIVKLKLYNNELTSEAFLEDSLYSIKGFIHAIKITNLSNNYKLITWISRISVNAPCNIMGQIIDENNNLLWENPKTLKIDEFMIQDYVLHNVDNSYLYLAYHNDYCSWVNLTCYNLDIEELWSLENIGSPSNSNINLMTLDNDLVYLFDNFYGLNIKKINSMGNILVDTLYTDINSDSFLDAFVKNNTIFVAYKHLDNKIKLIKFNALCCVDSSNIIDYSATCLSIIDAKYSSFNPEKNQLSFMAYVSDHKELKTIFIDNNLSVLNEVPVNIWSGYEDWHCLDFIIYNNKIHYLLKIRGSEFCYAKIQILDENSNLLFNPCGNIYLDVDPYDFVFSPNPDNNLSLAWISKIEHKLLMNNINSQGIVNLQNLEVDAYQSKLIFYEHFYKQNDKILAIWIETSDNSYYKLKYQIYDFQGNEFVSEENQIIVSGFSYNYKKNLYQDQNGNVILYYPDENIRIFTFPVNNPGTVNSYYYYGDQAPNYVQFIETNQKVLVIFNCNVMKYVKITNAVAETQELINSHFWGTAMASYKDILVFCYGSNSYVYNCINEDFEAQIGNTLLESIVIETDGYSSISAMPYQDDYLFIESNLYDRHYVLYRYSQDNLLLNEIVFDEEEGNELIFLSTSTDLYLIRKNLQNNSFQIICCRFDDYELNYLWIKNYSDQEIIQPIIINDRLLISSTKDYNSYIQVFMENGDTVYDSLGFQYGIEFYSKPKMHYLADDEYLISDIKRMSNDICLFSLDSIPLNENNHDLVKPLLNLQIYPNPFNPIANLSFIIENDTQVNIEIFNIKGQKIRTLANSRFVKGVHNLVWDAKSDNHQPLASGVYFCKIKAANQQQIKKLILLK